MPTLVFPERDALRLVLASGGVASPAMRAPATVGWDEDGRLWLTTAVTLPRETTVALQRFGVRIVGSSAVRATESIACWQQLLPLEKLSSSPTNTSGIVIFDVPGPQISSLVGEIERCGGKSWSIEWLDDIAIDDGSDRVLIKTEAPP
jgi:hypothetical protein